MQELSNVAVRQFLNINEAPRLTAVGRDPEGAFQFRLTAGIGFRYTLETSSNLLSWTPWLTVTNMARTILITDMTALFAPQRFYRARAD